MFCFRRLYYNLTLNIATCFDPQEIIIREPNQSNITKNHIRHFYTHQISQFYTHGCIKLANLFFAVLFWFGSLMMTPFGTKHVGIFSIKLQNKYLEQYCAFCWLSVAN